MTPRPASSVKLEAWQLTRLATPLILASLLNMGISVTDIVMMRWLGTGALAAGAVASDYYSIVFHLVSPFAAQALGMNNRERAGNALMAGLTLAVLLALPGTAVVWHSPLLLAWIGVSPEVVQGVGGYIRVMSLALASMLAATVAINVLSAHHRTYVVYRVSIVALIVNALGNHVFMFGNSVVPAMGLVGAGVSSLIVSVLLCGMLIGYVFLHQDLRYLDNVRRCMAASRSELLPMLRTGLPIGIARLGELGVYLVSTVVIGIFGAEELAAHALTLRLTGVLYALPLGLSQAATVRAALAIGASDPAGFRRVAAAALMITVVVVFADSLAVYLLKEPLAKHFLGGQDTLVLCVTLMQFLVVVHPIHGIGTVCDGLLRGNKDTCRPMWLTLVAFWGVGFAGGGLLALHGGLGARALHSHGASDWPCAGSPGTRRSTACPRRTCR